MFRIARIRLSGVGPSDARFDKPSPDAPAFEVSCLGAEGQPDDTVIWLENGGGKTVFLSLLFHVLRPDRAAQIGNDDQGGRRADIGDFVAAGSVAHVVCEWVAADSAERLLTGLVAERRGATVNRTWYLLSIRDDAMSLDDVTFDVDGRRLPASRYLEALEHLVANAGKAGRRNRVEFTKTSIQRQWFDVLGDHGLDPALFDYQVRMNRSEGGATSLFRFASAERFVEFFLQLTMNPDTVSAVSDELVRVAEKVASLPRKELELAHATGAGERLATLLAKWRAFERATADALQARTGAEGLHDRLHAAVLGAVASLASAEAELAAAEEERSRVDRARREADTRWKMAEIALAEARIAALENDVAAAEDVEADRSLTARAWTRLAQHQRLASLKGRIAETRHGVDLADQGAQPLRDRRDQILRGLRRELQTAIDTAGAEHEAATSARDRARRAEGIADRQLRMAEARINEIAGVLTGYQRTVEIHARALERAVGEGVLARGADIGSALTVARDNAAILRAHIADTREQREGLVQELPSLRDEVKRSLKTASDAERESLDHARTVDDAVATRGRLAAHPLAKELGAEDADLELVGAEVMTRAAQEADRLRGEAIAVHATAAGDQRAADHLERERLLPPRATVEALCRQLRQQGVASAVPGWRYLVEVIPAADHAALIATHPAVVDGIVVATSDLDRARALLADSAPAAAVVVAAGTVLSDNRDTIGWVVPPAAAMHDPSFAEAEIERTRARLAESDDQASAFETAERSARAFANELEDHVTRWPTGTLPAARELAIELASRAAGAAALAASATQAVSAAEELVAEADAVIERSREDLHGVEDRIARLLHLQTSADQASEAELEIRELRAERDSLTQSADASRTALGAARDDSDEATRAMHAAERAADTTSEALAGLPDPGDGETTDESGIVHLRAAYERACGLVDEATTSSELTRQLAALESDRAAAETDWLALDITLRERVVHIASTAAASDAASRRRAEADAEAQHAAVARDVASKRARLEVAKSERANLPDPEPTWRVEPFALPFALDELEALTANFASQFEAARQAGADIREVVASRTEERDLAKQRHEAVSVQRDALVSTLGDRTALEASPFEGDPNEAVRDAMRRLRETADARENADREWHAAAHALGVFARDSRWSQLEGEMCRRLRDDEPVDLARSSDELLSQTRILESRLRDDIARLDTHRLVLITSLGDAVNEAARALRSARRKSELPAGLGEWSGQPFLKVALELATDPSERDAQLRRFTNSLLERAAAASGSLPAGADLICQALLACAERAVTVDVLKPNKAQRLQYVPITETGTLSGGMRATAAIAMFCTLAKVRAANRTGRVGVGTLVLDNPLGDANATYLVALQRLVARMSDVQLIYTTGVNDFDALRLFPVITRLTNEIGKRTHLSYVVADEAFLKQLAPSDGDSALITGTRLVRRTPPILTSDVTAMAGDDD